MKFQPSRWMSQHLSHKFVLTMMVSLLTTFVFFSLLFVQIYYRQEDIRPTVINGATATNSFKSSGLRPTLVASNSLAGKEFFVAPRQSVTERGVLRTVNHLRDHPACANCHHLTPEQSFTGIWLDANVIRHNYLQTAVLLIMAGGFMVILSWVIMGWFMRHFVLLPMSCLIQAGQAIESGVLDHKMFLCCHDEWQTLAHLFNQMTQKLQESLRCTQEQKIFFQAFLNAIPDGIRVINQNYQVVTANQAYHQQLGLPLTTLSTTRPDLPCYAASHARQHPCSPMQVTCPLHEIKKTGQPLKTTMEFMRMDGTKLQVEVCAAPMQIVMNGHSETFIVESVRDLTQTLQFSHEQKLASLGQLAAGVAHDIHNPLSSIRLALQAALRSLESATPNLSSVNKYLKLTDKQIDKCIAVTRRLLKLAAPGSEHLQLVCLKEVVTETVCLLEFEAKERGIEIHTDFSGPESRLLAIDSDMRMLIFNLLQNAFHAMPEGGYIEVQLRSRPGNLQLSIQDSGVGIPPHLLNKIFEPFFSHHLHGKTGSGLGLSICKNIVERHHGRIEVSQTDQRGSQFIVTLPDIQHAQPLAKAG